MHERAWLAVLSMAMIAALVVFLIDPEPARSPADAAALDKIVEEALESNSASRFSLWRAAHEQIVRLDPNRPTASAAFVRSGLFHWYELSDADRRSVIMAIEPLLRDGMFFDAMALPLFRLTGDFSILRRANPGTTGVMWKLASLAVTNGHFDDYRLFREQLRKRRIADFEAEHRTAAASELVGFVPVPATTADLPLLDRILHELHVRPVDDSKADPRQMNELIDFALDHDLQPLDGIEAVIHIAGAAGDPQRARLAVRLGQLDRADDIESASSISDKTQWRRYDVERAISEMRRHEPLLALRYLEKAGDSPDTVAATEEIQRMSGNRAEAASAHAALVAKANDVTQWLGTCGEDVCEHASGMVWTDGAPFALKLAAVQSDEVPPYAEVYTDDALTAEGAVSPSLLVHATLSRGIHRIDVRLANPMTRNAVRRRIRIE